jgi:hypothetical protein
MEEDFRDYKKSLIDNMEQFKSCRDAHASEFKDIRREIGSMRKDILVEAKEIIHIVNRMEKRLILVESKSGILGTIGGALAGLVPFAIYYFSKH